jgi:hypothetical protein
MMEKPRFGILFNLKFKYTYGARGYATGQYGLEPVLSKH